jgi:hypothetical protein
MVAHPLLALTLLTLTDVTHSFYEHIYNPFYLFYAFGVSEDQIALV